MVFKTKKVALLLMIIILTLTFICSAETNWGWSTLQNYKEYTGNEINEYKEAPMLKEKVSKGELPSIDKRLPLEPLVDKPFEEVGEYSNKPLKLAQLNPAVYYPAALHTVEYILNLDREAKKIVPNIAKNWEFSDGGKTFTLYLREGMRWSDGQPFTAEDFEFYWDAVVMNDEISPVKPDYFKPGNELATFEKVDKYTIRYNFEKPYYSFVNNLTGIMFRGYQNQFFLPKHAVKKYHIDYNPDANKLAEEAGYEEWWELFNYKRKYDIVQQRVGIPSVAPWVMAKETPNGIIFERNPYYFKIDTAGNQLPYIDKVTTTIFGDVDTLLMKMTAGEYDYQDWSTSIRQYPTLVNEQENGGYNLWNAQNLWTAYPALVINQNYPDDEVIGDILRNVKFRQALSLAINREEFNDLTALGKGTPNQATIHPSASFYKEEWGKAYTEYDPEKANELLDEIGLDQKDSSGFRKRPDGKPFVIIIKSETGNLTTEMVELIKDYWQSVGLQTKVKILERSLLWKQAKASDFMINGHIFDGSMEQVIASGFNSLLKGEFWGEEYETWYNTDGEKGIEPPADVKRMFNLYTEVPFLSEQEKNKALTELFDIWAEKLFMIGTVGMVPKPGISNVNLGNVDTDTFTDNASIGCGTFNRIYQFYWK